MIHYLCRCDDGPAKDSEFRDFLPPVNVGLPHGDNIFEYRLTSMLDDVCIYHYNGPPDEQSAA